VGILRPRHLQTKPPAGLSALPFHGGAATSSTVSPRKSELISPVLRFARCSAWVLIATVLLVTEVIVVALVCHCAGFVDEAYVRFFYFSWKKPQLFVSHYAGPMDWKE
jgi:hypothetical protein